MMLHQLLVFKRPLIVLDVETTGLDPKEARIVEIGMQIWDGEKSCKNCENYITAFKSGTVDHIPDCEHCRNTGRIEGGMQKEWRSLINPGVPIHPETTKVHGIDDVRMQSCNRCGHERNSHPPAGVHPNLCAGSGGCDCSAFHTVPTFAQLAPNLARGFSGCDFAGKNVRYDLRVLAVEFGRAGVAWSYMNSRIVDAERLEQLGEPRHLSNLYEKHVGHLCTECGKTRGDGNHDSGMIDYSHAFKGKKLEDAHQALADVRATTEVIVAQLRKYATLPRDLDALHAAQWPHLADAIDVDGKFKFVSGVPYVGNWGKWANCPMSRVDVGYWKFILGADFSADVKKLASDALMGVFPEVKR